MEPSTADNVGNDGGWPSYRCLEGPDRRQRDPQTRSILDRLLGLRRDAPEDVHVMRCGPFLRGQEHGRELDD